LKKKGANMTLHNEQGQTLLDVINAKPAEEKSIAQETPVPSTTEGAQILSQQSASSSPVLRGAHPATFFGASMRKNTTQKANSALDAKSEVIGSNILSLAKLAVRHSNLFSASTPALTSASSTAMLSESSTDSSASSASSVHSTTSMLIVSDLEDDVTLSSILSTRRERENAISLPKTTQENRAEEVPKSAHFTTPSLS
jgi:hypothetical protein